MSFTAHEETYRGFTIKIEAMDGDYDNPYTDFDQASDLVLHEQAERHFGWSTDKQLAQGLQELLEEIRDRRWARSVPGDSNSAGNLYGPGGAIEVAYRWARAFGGIRMAIPFGAGEHSGTWVYLGTGASFGDAGGWDSGWVGAVVITDGAVKECFLGEPVDDDRVRQLLEGEFETFQAYVAGEVYGWVAEDPDGNQVEDGSCWGYYGDANWETTDEHPHGWMQEEARSAIDSHLNRLHEAALAEDVERCWAEAQQYLDHTAMYRKLVDH